MGLLILGVESGIGAHTFTVGLAKIGGALKVRIPFKMRGIC